MAISKLFTGHPASVGETYWQHFRFAIRVFISLMKAAIGCFIHAVFPQLFQTTASTEIRTLYEDIEARTNHVPLGSESPTPSSTYPEPALQGVE